LHQPAAVFRQLGIGTRKTHRTPCEACGIGKTFLLITDCRKPVPQVPIAWTDSKRAFTKRSSLFELAGGHRSLN
jgi:hypothetical protein